MPLSCDSTAHLARSPYSRGPGVPTTPPPTSPHPGHCPEVSAFLGRWPSSLCAATLPVGTGWVGGRGRRLRWVGGGCCGGEPLLPQTVRSPFFSPFHTQEG